MNPIRHLRKIKDRGWKAAAFSVLREIRSRRIFAVVARNCSETPTKIEAMSEINFAVVCKGSGTDWLPRVAAIWPAELEQYREGKLIGALQARIEKEQICIISHSDTRVLGALWITLIPIDYRIYGPEFGTEWRMVKSFFVTHEARGKGLGKKLLQFAVHFGHDAGWSGLVSLVLECREPSLRAHHAAGFTRIGRITSDWNFFSQNSRFSMEPISETVDSKSSQIE